MKPQVLVLYNSDTDHISADSADFAACSENREVAVEVTECLKALGYEVGLDVAENLFATNTATRNLFDVIFNLCEGFRGNSRLEGAFTGWMELRGFTCTGNGSWTLNLCQDKAATKRILQQSGISTPSFHIVPVGARHASPQQSGAVIVKPLREDASQGITRRSVVNISADPAALTGQIRFIHDTYDQPALVEQYIEGRELNVALLDGEVLPISEIDFSELPDGHPPICTYEAKWEPSSEAYMKTPPRCPAQLDKTGEQRVKEIAVKAWHAMRCRGYARVDIRLRPDGTPFVLEVNPNPSIHRDAGFSRSAFAAGLGYGDTLERIINTAVKRNP